MCALCDEEQKRDEAAKKVGFLSNGMWVTTDGQPFYSKRMAINVQILIDEDEKVNDEQ